MKEIQNSLLKFAQSNKYFSALLKIDAALAIIYPIYSLVVRIIFLSAVWKYIGMLSAVFYIAYFIGTILCFAENKQILLAIAFGCRAINYIFTLRLGISFNSLVYIAFYGLITGVCIVEAKRSAQWSRLKENTFSKAARYAEAADDALSNKPATNSFCPNCGAKLDKKMKFCNKCGKPINQ